MNIIITGASGFIGKQIVRDLKEQGNDIWAISRKVDKTKRLPNVNYWEVDLLDIDEVIARDQFAENKIDVVIHTAGQAHVVQNEKTRILFYRNNVEATQSALKLACIAGAKRFIHYSSVAVIDDDSMYANSKKESEALVQEFCQKNEMSFVIIRPVVVFGEGDTKGNVYKLIKQINNGIVPLIDNGKNIKNMIYVRNLSAYVTRILRDATYDNTILLMRDQEVVSMKEICQSIVLASKRKCIFIPINYYIWRLVLIIFSLIPKIGFIKAINIVSLRKVTRDSNFELDQLSSELIKKPPYTLNQGIINTVNWVKKSMVQ